MSGTSSRLVVALLALPFLVALRGWAASVTWNWFVPQVFENAPRLGVWQAVGLALVVQALVGSTSSEQAAGSEEERWAKLVSGLVQSAMLSLFVVGTSWIVWQFMGG